MKKVIKLTESDLNRMVNLILEGLEDEYENDDFYEVFFELFRPWVRKKHGDEVGEYPVSFLIKKYVDEFLEDYGVSSDQIAHYNRKNPAYLGRVLATSGKHKFRSLRPQVKFTEKFEKPLNAIVNSFNFPEFIKIQFNEYKPYEAGLKVLVDIEEYLKSGVNPRELTEIFPKIQNKIEKYLGVEFGRPGHGQLTLKNEGIDYPNIDEWVKNTLNKDIKKRIKSLPGGKNIHRIQFLKTEYGRFKIKIIFKDNWNTDRYETVRTIRELLQNMGYDIGILNVEH